LLYHDSEGVFSVVIFAVVVGETVVVVVVVLVEVLFEGFHILYNPEKKSVVVTPTGFGLVVEKALICSLVLLTALDVAIVPLGVVLLIVFPVEEIVVVVL